LKTLNCTQIFAMRYFFIAGLFVLILGSGACTQKVSVPEKQAIDTERLRKDFTGTRFLFRKHLYRIVQGEEIKRIRITDEKKEGETREITADLDVELKRKGERMRWTFKTRFFYRRNPDGKWTHYLTHILNMKPKN